MSPERASGERERAVAFVLAALVMLQFVPAALAGLTPFWGDLTYIHHPWRALPAQVLESGRLPLWNPYIYFGMPMAAAMQGGLYYPGTLPFFLFDFSTGVLLFHLFHYWLAGWLMYLWLRKMRLSRIAALAGGVAYCLGGMMVSRIPFLNHLAVLSLGPAVLLFFRRPWLLGAALTLAFLAGYPTFLPGLALAAWSLRVVLGKKKRFIRDGVVWVLAAGGAMVAGAVMLIPALELSFACRRSGGLDLAETLMWGFQAGDMVQWISPLLVKGFDPAVDWYKCAYLGFAGWAAVALGFLALSWRKAAGLAALLALVAVLILGGTNPVSTAFWAYVPVLKFVRYPGNLSYLAWPALALLVAAGIEACRRSGKGWLGRSFAGRVAPALLAACIVIELASYALGALALGAAPLTGRGLFSSAGPLVRQLESALDSMRYLMSPLALNSSKGNGVLDWKWRLYGLTNAPFRISAGGNFGEPLVPKNTYAFMDFLYSRSAGTAARFMPWGGMSALLTPRALSPEASGPLRYEGHNLWHMYSLEGVAKAYFLDDAAGRALPAGIPERSPPLGLPLSMRWEREDRFVIEGTAPRDGWVFVSEPRYPGWDAFLETSRWLTLVETLPALEAFQKVAVLQGPFKLTFHYDPPSFHFGLLLTLVCVLASGVYWYNRILHVP